MMLCGKILIYGSGTSTSGGAAAGAAAAVLFDGSLLAVRLPVRAALGVPLRNSVFMLLCRELALL